ncbi:hypothetical protein R83H12_03145 [Fibrobacteria bacterium R8-3-H12]
MRIAILSIALMSALCFGKGQTQKQPLPEQLQGTIPDFQTKTIENESGLSRDNLKEKAKKAGAKRVVLSFFSTTCVHCREEFALLRKKAGELEKNKVQVHLINSGESVHKMGEEVSKFVKEHAGDSFPFYFDPNWNLLKKSGLVKGDYSPLPQTIVLDSDLRVLFVLSEISADDYPEILWEEL